MQFPSSHPDDLPSSFWDCPEAVLRAPRDDAWFARDGPERLRPACLRNRSGGFVPRFRSESMAAPPLKLLFLFERPGPESFPPTGSGFVSHDNEGPAALACRAAMAAAGHPEGGHGRLEHGRLVERDARCHIEAEMRDGARELPSLVRLLPKLRGVVLVGAGAQAYGGPVLDGTGLLLFRSVHIPPSASD